MYPKTINEAISQAIYTCLNCVYFKKPTEYKPWRHVQGIFMFVDTIENKAYIGSAKCLATSIKDHFQKKTNKHLSRVIKLYAEK